MQEDQRSDASVKSLEKAMNILEVLSASHEDMDLVSLSKKTKIPKSTLLRILNTMKKHNFVQQDNQSRRFGLGWALINIGQNAKRNFNLINFIHPFLEELQIRTGETISLAMREGNHAYYVDQVVSTNMVKAVPTIGSPLDLYCTASGKLFLSKLKEDELTDMINAMDFRKKTEFTIISRKGLTEEIRKIQDQGYSLDNEEAEMGGRCVAAPVLDQNGEIQATISVVGPTSRMGEENVRKIIEIVCEVAADASAALGFDGKG